MRQLCCGAEVVPCSHFGARLPPHVPEAHRLPRGRKLNTKACVKCDAWTSIASKLPTADLESLKTESRTRDSVSALALVGCTQGFYQTCPSCLLLSVQLFSVRSTQTSEHSCFIPAAFVSSQQDFVSKEEINKTFFIYSAPCKMWRRLVKH